MRRRTTWLFLLALVGGCTTDSDVNAASCEDGGSGLPDQTGASTGGDHLLAASSDPCAPVVQGEPGGERQWECEWANADASGLWQWGGLGSVTDPASAEAECERELGAGADCFGCGAAAERPSPGQNYTCTTWGTCARGGEVPEWRRTKYYSCTTEASARRQNEAWFRQSCSTGGGSPKIDGTDCKYGGECKR